jgi:hypothetical protein
MPSGMKHSATSVEGCDEERMLREATRIRYYSHPSSLFLSFGVEMVARIYTKSMEAAQESFREELKEILVFFLRVCND